MINKIQREICSDCKKNILIGQRYLECNNCLKIIHKNCFRSSNFSLCDTFYICPNCVNINKKRYNPFKYITSNDGVRNSDDDKFYSEDLMETFSCIKKASNMLENCSYYKLKSENSIEYNMVEACDFKTPIYNIDGNRSNFDTFSSELQTQNTKYSIIALAETNISKDKGDLYPLIDYTHYYNDKLPNKSKGSGVCMYVHNSFNATVNNKLCLTTKNIESLFLTVNKGNSKVNVGVIYRSPSGDSKEFHKEFAHLTSQFPKHMKSIILGDYNFDLLRQGCTEVSKFEELILSHGFFPLISIPTHSTSITQSSCIDNLFTNNIESVLKSGVIVIDDLGSNHRPIFAMFHLNISPTSPCSEPKQIQ